VVDHGGREESPGGLSTRRPPVTTAAPSASPPYTNRVIVPQVGAADVRFHRGVLSQRVTDLDLIAQLGNTLDHLVSDVPPDQQPRSGVAAFTLVDVRCPRGRGDSRVQVSIGENDVWCFPSELQ
jgi:hypothetical protein